MPSTNFTFCTPKSEALLKAVIDHLAKTTATVSDLSAAIGRSEATTRMYLAHLRGRNKVDCLAEAIPNPRRGSVPAVWMLNRPGAPRAPVNQGPVIEAGIQALDDDELDLFPRKVVVRRSGEYPPNHTRMGLDCYLFGVPAALQREAA